MNQKYPSANFASWRAIVVLSGLFVILQLILSWEMIGVAAYRVMAILKITHALLALAVGIYIFLSRKVWTPRLALITTSLLYIPSYVFLFFHYYHVENILTVAPFNFLKVHFVIFPFFRLGNYRTNAAFILIAFFEFVFLWYNSTLPAYFSVNKMGEPYVTLLFFVTSLFFLLTRYKDDIQVSRLTIKLTRLELSQKLTRIVLTLKDRTNSPLQTLMLYSEVTLREDLGKSKTVTIMKRNIEKIVEINNMISKVTAKVKPKIGLSGNIVLSDQELVRSIEEVLGQDSSIKSPPI